MDEVLFRGRSKPALLTVNVVLGQNEVRQITSKCLFTLHDKRPLGLRWSDEITLTEPERQKIDRICS